MRITFIASWFILILLFGACQKENDINLFFFPKNPGDAICKIIQHQLILSNNSVEAIWEIENESLALKQLSNKFDNQVVNFEAVTLFSVELENGMLFTNHDFFVQKEPTINDISATDSLPTLALRFPGKEITVLLAEKNGNLIIKWKAQLRNGSNYIRQNIEIKAKKGPAKITKITFFDGVIEGAEMAGSVIGSPIEYKNFFFGLEHPIAHSKALLTRNIGSITQKSVDVSKIINAPGEYIVSVEHGGGPANFNIEYVALVENNKQISIDRHKLNGADGNSFYSLNVEKYDVANSYYIQPEISNIEHAGGIFHIHRKTKNILNFYTERVDLLDPEIQFQNGQ